MNQQVGRGDSGNREEEMQNGDLRGQLVSSLVVSDTLERPVTVLRRCEDFNYWASPVT